MPGDGIRAPNSVEIVRDTPERWFAVRVRSHCEKAVTSATEAKGFEAFLPLYRCRRRWSDRLKALELPLFPGYTFCRLAPERRLPLLTIPGVLHFVCAGQVPVPVEDAEILLIRAAVQSGLWTEPWPFPQVGQRVRLIAGPLKGFEGIFVEDSNEKRVILSITLLKRSIAVSVERQWTVPLASERPGGIEFAPLLLRSRRT